jgi:hypothetical protein
MYMYNEVDGIKHLQDALYQKLTRKTFKNLTIFNICYIINYKGIKIVFCLQFATLITNNFTFRAKTI